MNCFSSKERAQQDINSSDNGSCGAILKTHSLFYDTAAKGGLRMMNNLNDSVTAWPRIPHRCVQKLIVDTILEKFHSQKTHFVLPVLKSEESFTVGSAHVNF